MVAEQAHDPRAVTGDDHAANEGHRTLPGARTVQHRVVEPTPLAGCVVGPVYQPPIVHVPERWGPEPVASSPTVQSDSVDHRWWRGFRDPLLVSLVDRLGTQNLDLRTAYERVLQSEARFGSPQRKASRRSRAHPRRPIPAEPNGPLGLSQKAPGAQLDYWLYAEGLTASWELDFFGRVRHALEAADAETLAPSRPGTG